MRSATFYLLAGNMDEIAFRYACNLIYQSWTPKFSAYLYCETIDIAKSLDDLLWTFKDTSFIPHQLIETPAYSKNIPIYIGSKDIGIHPSHNEGAMLINLTEEIPSFYTGYSHIVEMVLDDTLKKEIARKKYKIYRDGHYQLATSKVAL